MEPYQRLEAEWAAFNGYAPEQVVACSSGTSALHLALESLQLPPGSQVIVPDYTMVACARAVTLAELTPVFADCLLDTLLIDPDHVDRLASAGAIAVMPVHVYGRRCDMGAVAMLAEKHWMYVVEDLAEAHGVRPHSRTDAACWSFYRNKIVGGEEGGAVAFRDVQHAALARQLRSLGFTDAHDCTHVPRGHNYRLANCLAEKVLNSLREYEFNHMTRRHIEMLYDAHCPDAWRMPPRNTPWVYDLRVRGMTEEQQTAAVRALQATGIAARHGFKPMTWQEEYRQKGAAVDTSKLNWNAARAATEVVYLPIQPEIATMSMVQSAFGVIEAALGA